MIWDRGVHMDVKKKLLALMEEKHWTYYRLSKEADVSWSTIRNMFDRGTEPTLPTLEAICKGLGITLEALLLGEDAADLSPDQRDLLSNWGKLDDADKRLYLDLLRSLNSKKQ